VVPRSSRQARRATPIAPRPSRRAHRAEPAVRACNYKPKEKNKQQAKK